MKKKGYTLSEVASIIALVVAAVAGIAFWLERDRALKEERWGAVIEINAKPVFKITMRYDEGLIKIEPDRFRENVKKAVADSVRK